MTIGTADRRLDARTQATYDIYIEIDCDCQELLDAIGLDYKLCEDDDTQNEVCISLDKDEWDEFTDTITWSPFVVDEQLLGTALLNPELGEYVTKVTIYQPNGNVVSFY